MRAGPLRHRLVIQSYAVTNTHGEVTKTWSTFATVWGLIEPLKGREFFESAIEEAEIDARVTIRYTSGVKPQMRITHDSRTYEIVSVIHPALAQRDMILMVKENVI